MVAVVFLLHGEPPDAAVYVIECEIKGDDTAVDAERLDLRRVTSISISEKVYAHDGNWWLSTKWRFQFDGRPEPLELSGDEIWPDTDPPRNEAARLGRQIAEAAGWAKETPDAAAFI
jgi:hypothetical protein